VPPVRRLCGYDFSWQQKFEMAVVWQSFEAALLEKLVNVRKIRHDNSVIFTEQVPYSFFPLVYGIKCVSVSFQPSIRYVVLRYVMFIFIGRVAGLF